MRLEAIGFYTLSDLRAKYANSNSDLQRCELLLTPKCNLKCPYCRGLNHDELSLPYAQYVLQLWIDEGLTNVRFSGGEPTMSPYLNPLIRGCKKSGVRRIAISTNGTQNVDYYKKLVDDGVNDFSISLDGGCCSIADKMTGVKGTFQKVSDNIRELSKLTYITVGVVFNEQNIDTAKEVVSFVDSLSPSDIRIISSAQYNRALTKLADLHEDILSKYPILKYRINNFRKGRNVRGIKKDDTHKCYLVRDDVAVAGNYHYPCIIYLREQGLPIGKMGENFREERQEWFEKHDTHLDEICRRNCLDVCIDYNNKCHEYTKNK